MLIAFWIFIAAAVVSLVFAIASNPYRDWHGRWITIAALSWFGVIVLLLAAVLQALVKFGGA